MRPFGHAFVVAALALAVACEAAAAPSFESLRARATALYRKGRYAQACALFERATRLAPQHGALWADLGLCEARRGAWDVARRASLLAVRFGDEATRLSAYYNLGTIYENGGLSNLLPEELDGCTEVSSDSLLACDRPAVFCRQHQVAIGNHGHGSASVWWARSCPAGCDPAALAGTPPAAAGQAENTPEACTLDVDASVLCEYEIEWNRSCGDDGCDVDASAQSCAVVAVDACTGRIGVACTQYPEPENRADRLSARELRLPDSPAMAGPLDALVARAERALRDGEARYAAALGKEAVRQAPSDPAAWHALARTSVPKEARELSTLAWQQVARLGDRPQRLEAYERLVRLGAFVPVPWEGLPCSPLWPRPPFPSVRLLYECRVRRDVPDGPWVRATWFSATSRQEPPPEVEAVLAAGCSSDLVAGFCEEGRARAWLPVGPPPPARLCMLVTFDPEQHRAGVACAYYAMNDWVPSELVPTSVDLTQTLEIREIAVPRGGP